jgi:ribonucleoside-diphosphate reductase alpha subunit
MRVIKRSGRQEEVSFDKVINRIKSLCDEAPVIDIDVIDIAQQVIGEICDGIKTTELDEEAAKKCAYMVTVDPVYGELASRIIISNNHKNTSNSFSETVNTLYNNTDIHGKSVPLVSEGLYKIVRKHKFKLNDVIDYSRDYGFDYFAFKTLERAYLIKINGIIIERIQHLIMRVAIGLHEIKILNGEETIKIALETYDMMSTKCFTHATPTLFHAGTPVPQLLSCFLLGMTDSIGGIYKCLADCAQISKWAGGIGVHINNIRAEGSAIRGTNGQSNGIVPMLKVFNETARYVDQCVMPETIIYTTEGPMEIQYCEAGKTQIFTTNGPEVIENVLEHPYEGSMLEIEYNSNAPGLMITPEHPIYCLKNTTNDEFKYSDIRLLKRKLDIGIIEPEWVEAKNLTGSEMITYTIPQYEKDMPQITEDDCYMYGIMLAHWTMSNSDEYYSISYETSKETIVDRVFIEKYLNNHFVKYDIQNGQYGRNNYTTIKWKTNIRTPFRLSHFYNKQSKGLSIHPDWLNLPKHKIKYLLKGIYTSVYHEPDIEPDFKGFIQLNTRDFLQSVHYMLLRCGIFGDLSESIRRYPILQIPNIQEVHDIISIPHITPITDCAELDAFTSFYFKHNNIIYTNITQINSNKPNTTYDNHIPENKLTYKGTLYDLQMKDTHNYMLSSGIVHNGGGKRKGSIAIYLAPWHADIENFLNLKKNHGKEEMIARDLFYAVWISDVFMNRVKDNKLWSLMCPDECPGLADTYGDEFKQLYEKYEREGKMRKQVSARELYNKICTSQIETGVPYILYSDAANKKSNQKNIGTIKSSNLCVAPETLVLTDKGHKQIETLKDQTVNVWNGKEFSETTVRKTGENQELIKVTFSDETSIECTKYHKFHIQNTLESAFATVEILEAQKLKENMTLIKCEYPIIDNEQTMKYPYIQGNLCGDGAYVRHTIMLPPDLDKIDLVRAVPINYSLRSKLDWFAGYCDANGYINDGDQSLQMRSHNKEYLINIKLMLQTCGIFVSIFKNETKEQWRLFVSSQELQKLVNSGFNPKRLKITEHRPNRTAYRFVKVKSVEYTNRFSDTYCFNESKRHVGIFNGIITGNCSEILEYSDDKEYACCTLGSLCLSQCVVEKDFSHVKEVVIYTKDKCNYCKLSKMLCKQYNLTVKEVNLTNDSKQLEQLKIEFKETYGAEFKSFPQILIIDGNTDTTGTGTENTENTSANKYTYIGGYVEFEEYTRAYYDFEKLAKMTKVLANNLNEVIDINKYPVPETELSNKRHRPLGIGVQGLADVYAMMRYPFDSKEAMQLNKEIFATIYYSAMQKSISIAKKDGPYSSFKGSPLSEGKFQHNLWEIEPIKQVGTEEVNHKILDWDTLRSDVMEFGARNSLLTALMPTASTSQIMGNNECIEPFTSNIYLRRVLAGEFIVINKFLLRDLKHLGLWNKEMKNTLIYYKGSVQEIVAIPSTLRALYKTCWDIKQKIIVDQCADRGPYICQTQSMNIHMAHPTRKDIQNLHMYSWKKGLKTGLYYLRTKGGKSAQQVTIDPKLREKLLKQENDRKRQHSNPVLLESEENKSLIDEISSFEGNKVEACENCSA